LSLFWGIFLNNMFLFYNTKGFMSTLGKDGGELQKLILPNLMFFLKCLVTILA